MPEFFEKFCAPRSRQLVPASPNPSGFPPLAPFFASEARYILLAIFRNTDSSSAEIDNTSLHLPPRRTELVWQAPACLRHYPCSAPFVFTSFAAIIFEVCYSII